MNFQEEYTAYRDANKTGHEGAIFGTKTDEENGFDSYGNDCGY